MKTCDKLDYCPHIQPITFPSQKNPPFCPDRVSVSKFCTSETCITPSEDLHHTIRGPASHHPRTCITPSKDLQQIIQMDLHVTQAGELEDKNNNCEVEKFTINNKIKTMGIII